MAGKKKASGSVDLAAGHKPRTTYPEKVQDASAGEPHDVTAPRLTKTAKIKEMARCLAMEMAVVRPKDIVEALKKEGITVSSPQVSMSLRGTGLAVRQQRTYRGSGHEPASHLRIAGSNMSIDDLLKAREYVRQIGSVEKAIAALQTYREFHSQRDLESEREPYAGAGENTAI